MTPRTNPTRRVNNALTRLFQTWHLVEDALSADENDGYYLCDISMAEWNTYVETEYQKYRSKYMTWRNGRVYITEISSYLHNTIASRLAMAVIFQNRSGISRHLSTSGSVYGETMTGLRIQPDCSIGPDPNVHGAQRPDYFSSWMEYHTLKVEVGVTEGWRGLDEKAERWWPFPGLKYILCVRVTQRRHIQQYKLYVVNQNPLPPQMTPIDIIDPTPIDLDARDLLGLDPNAILPLGFPDPKVTINLFHCLQRLL